MAKDRNEFKAGLFIVASVVLILAVIVAIKGLGRIIEQQQVRTATFSLADVLGGLRLGDDVRVGGLKVGAVRSLTIEPPADEKSQPRIVVAFHMPRRIVLRDGARVGVQSTITGTSWLNFDALGTGQPLGDDVSLPGRPSGYTTLLN